MNVPTRKQSVDGYARLGAAAILAAIHDLKRSKKILADPKIMPRKRRQWIAVQNGCIDFLQGDMEPWSTACGIDVRDSYGVHKCLEKMGLAPMGELVAEDPQEEEKSKHAPAMMKALGEASITIREIKSIDRGW